MRRKSANSMNSAKLAISRKNRRKPATTRVLHRKRKLTYKRPPPPPQRKNFSSNVSTVVYGKLYSNMCGHCISLEPTWKQLNDHFETQTRKFPHARVLYKDVSIENTDLSNGISEVNREYLANSPTKMESPLGFPTIFRIYNGKLEYYDGNRDYHSLLKWIIQK